MSINRDYSGISRLKFKTSEEAIIQEIAENFHLTPFLAKGYFQEISKYFEKHTTENLCAGEMVYEAISDTEPAGKKIKVCQRVLIRLTLSSSNDWDILKEKGLPVLRRHKILRLANEARAQNAVLTCEDLASILNTCVSTIKADCRQLRQQKEFVPTRGWTHDIGRSLSHKTQIIDLYLRGYQFTDIERRTHHSAYAIERYLNEFRRTVYLVEQNMNVAQIRIVTKRSENLIKQYIQLWQKAKDNSERYLKSNDLLEGLTKFFKKKHQTTVNRREVVKQ